MRVPFVDVRSQYAEVRETLDPWIQEILETGAYVLGKHNRALEEEVARRHGVKHGVAVNSGTDALRIMLDACGVGPGDEVITTAFTFVASVEVILQAGARPVFVDIEPQGFMIDPNQVEDAVTDRTKAILPVHLFGQLADVEALADIARRRGLMVLEDAAQAIDSSHHGVYAGNFGLAAGLSFYVTKNLGAAGDAGMILTNDDDVAEKARSMRVHGMGRERYYYDYVGYTSRMDEIQAAVLRAKLQRLRAWNERRGELAALYGTALEGVPVCPPKVLPGNNHTWHQYSIVTTRRDELQAFLKDRGVDSMIYYPVPLHLHSPYRHLANGPGSLPVTERISREILSLPIQPHLTDEQVLHAAAKVREFFGA
ncbi:MAG: DegT/DnrJ/EryC1/StrS family aminotransferase [Fimbriimonadales bacterium]|nr:DegT/DnrJ/EryC1/StrS family aminotransferase [Fimbriimonadales bacterium]